MRRLAFPIALALILTALAFIPVQAQPAQCRLLTIQNSHNDHGSLIWEEPQSWTIC